MIDPALGCSTSSLILFPNGSSPSVPLQYQRSQDIYISSYIQLNCNSSRSPSTYWTIKNCTISCSSVVQISSAIDTSLSELLLPANTLSYGTYQLTLTVTIAFNVTLSTSVYVTISPSTAVANLIQFGTSTILQGAEQDLTMNPGAFSVDPDSDTFNAEVSVYQDERRYPSRFAPHRTGTMHTTVESMVNTISPVWPVRCSRSMTREWIQTTHHACRMDQVGEIPFGYSFLSIATQAKYGNSPVRACHRDPH